MQTVRNPQGIPVKVCCASCAYRQLVDTQARRRCAIREEKVKPNQVSICFITPSSVLKNNADVMQARLCVPVKPKPSARNLRVTIVVFTFYIKHYGSNDFKSSKEWYDDHFEE